MEGNLKNLDFLQSLKQWEKHFLNCNEQFTSIFLFEWYNCFAFFQFTSSDKSLLIFNLDLFEEQFSYKVYHHSWMDSSAPTILLPRVRVTSTPSMLLSFILKFVLYFSSEKDENIQKEAELKKYTIDHWFPQL